MPVITLTTDFGSKDWFVGTMKGVMLGIAPRATLVDITHEIAPGDLRGGAFALGASYRFFPKGTVHLVVVDPGVGSARRAIAVQTADYCFVGPDNGVLSWALAREPVKAIHALENDRYFLHPVSRTFHGRDIFAPVAAHLSRGLELRKVGPALKEMVRLAWPHPQAEGRGVRGEVVYLDRFGNAITNIDADKVRRLGAGPLAVWLGRKRLCAVAEFYQAVPQGHAVAVVGSSGFLEIAVNGGSAQERFGLHVGSACSVRSA
jgi:S-adenosyl-L-methionine hydrolase (adenosine-forming)